MKKLWCDLRSDAERSDYILSGQAYDAGVIAHAIQADVALAFHRCSEYGSEVRQLREENERLRKDAERYRWLRDAGATFYTGGPEITDGSDKVHVCEFAMDAAIDAAKRKLQQPEQVPGAERYIDRLIAEEK